MHILLNQDARSGCVLGQVDFVRRDTGQLLQAGPFLSECWFILRILILILFEQGGRCSSKSSGWLVHWVSSYCLATVPGG